MKSNRFLSEGAAAVPPEIRPRSNRLAVCQDRLTQRFFGPIDRVATCLTAPPRTPAKPRSRIFIVEDDSIFRDRLLRFLSDVTDLIVCGTASGIGQALPAIARAKPDLVLLDLGNQLRNGLKPINVLRSKDHSVKVLVLSVEGSAWRASRALRSGGDGYIIKRAGMDEIVNAIHDLLNGRIYVSEEVVANASGRGRNPSVRA